MSVPVREIAPPKSGSERLSSALSWRKGLCRKKWHTRSIAGTLWRRGFGAHHDDCGGRTGCRKVKAVMMPSQFTADISLPDARAMAQTLGVRYSEFPSNRYLANSWIRWPKSFPRCPIGRPDITGGKPASAYTRNFADGTIE